MQNMRTLNKEVKDYALQVTLCADKNEFDTARRLAYMDNTDRYPVPGCAPGLAQLADLQKTYGPAVLFDEALASLIPNYFNEFLQKEKIRIFGKPEVNDVQFLPDGGVSFQIKADMFPQVELGQYRDIAVPFVRMEQQAEFEQAVLQKACENMKGEIPPALIEQKMNAILAQEKLNIHNDAVYHLLADMLVILDEAYVAAGAVRPKVQVRREAMDLMLQCASAEHELDWRDFLKEQVKVMAERYHSLPADFDKKIDAIMKKREDAKHKMSPDALTDELFKAYLGSLELTEDQWKNQRMGQAAKDVCIDLLLEAVAEKEDLSVSNEEIHAGIEELASRYGLEPEEAEANIDKGAFAGKLVRDKALTLILNAAKTDYEAKAALDKKRAEAAAKMNADVEVKN